MVIASRHDRSAPIASPSTSFASEENRHMLRIRLNSISKLEAQNLKRRLIAELEEVRSLINRLDPPRKTCSMAKPPKRIGHGSASAFDKGTIQILKKCNNLLTKLMNHRDGWVFNSPVDVKVLGLYDYHTIVKEPMDLGTVKAKLERSLYNSPLDFAGDVRLTFNNALLYNPVWHEVHLMAKILLNMFEEKWVSIEKQYDNLHRKLRLMREVELPAPTCSLSRPRLPPVVKNRTLERVESMKATTLEPETVSNAPPKKPEEDVFVNNRDLTFDEKRRLTGEILDLPNDKLETVVHIIKKRNPGLSQQDDEIDLDMDCVNIETLWELHRFVSGYKESLSKKKENHGFGHNIIQEPITLASVSETSGVTESGKAIRASTPIREENKASSGSSSSSNSSPSSSDSGSCTSDSDSDSSSGC
ncbi:unnamed protein product [Cochlearia groenlandica]